MSELILGPQLPLTTNWFDTTQIARARILGDACPAVPPADTEAQVIRFDNLTTSFNFLHYYDLPLCLYIAHKRSGDASLLTLARKCADSWWQHPQWVNSGNARLWPNSVTPNPRHAGIGGLILRALDGKPEYFDWSHGYTRFHFDHWVKKRVGACVICNKLETDAAHGTGSGQHPYRYGLFYGVREGAFALHYATWLAVTHPDSAIRAAYLADIQTAATGYYGALQQPDGSWRWDDSDVKDADGGTLKGITQPFMVGLLLCALADVHQIATDATAKENIKNQILKGCRHLYEGGPYRKDDPVAYDPTKRWRCFWYLYHGGTSVNPTKFARGGWGYAGNNSGEVSDQRQSIGPVVGAYGYAYKISGDPAFKAMGDELWDAAYGGSDGIRNLFTADGKSYNQNARRAGSYLAWAGAQPSQPPSPAPTPTPSPTTPTPPAQPSPDGTKGDKVTDAQGGLWTIGPSKETLRNSIHMGGGSTIEYKYSGGDVYAKGLRDGKWYKWWTGIWSLFGDGLTEPGATSPLPDPAPVPQPPAPTPSPLPTPTPAPVPVEEYKVESFSGTEASRTAVCQRMWTLGYGYWSETDTDAKGNKIKFRKFK